MHKDNVLKYRSQQLFKEATANSFDPAYLAAKKRIDDQSLNHHVWQTLCRNLPHSTGKEPAAVLEIGAGIGTMFERVVDRGLLRGHATYVASDSDAALLAAAGSNLSQWSKERGHAISWTGKEQAQLYTAEAEVSLLLEAGRAEEFAERSELSGTFHLLIAHAVLDLFDFRDMLPRLFPLLKDNGLAYLTCNFDGETIFLPKCDDDAEIIKRYHGSMEKRLNGASHTGRRLLAFLLSPGIDILAAGSSDWVIHPKNRAYSVDEAFFLHAIIETVEGELKGEKAPFRGLADWASRRHQQVETGELSFIARHLDFLARIKPSTLF